MNDTIRSSRDVILRTERWHEALRFYETVLGFKIVYRDEKLVGFDTGTFVLYVEHGEPHGPVFDFLTPEVQALKTRLIASGCQLLEDNPGVPRCYLQDPFGLVFNLGTRGSGV